VKQNITGPHQPQQGEPSGCPNIISGVGLQHPATGSTPVPAIVWSQHPGTSGFLFNSSVSGLHLPRCLYPSPQPPTVPKTAPRLIHRCQCYQITECASFCLLTTDQTKQVCPKIDGTMIKGLC